MSKQELQPKTADSIIAKSNASADSTLHRTVFNSPDEYLNVLKNNFSALSRGSGQLGLPELTIDAKDLSLSPDLRQAASIAAKNFGQLLDMTQQQQGGPQNGLKQSDLSFVDDMVNGKVVGRTAKNIGEDLVAVGGTGFLGWAGLGMASAGFEGGISATLAEGAIDLVALGSVGAVLAVGSLAAAGYMAYRSTTEYKRVKAESSDDAKQVSQWIK